MLKWDFASYIYKHTKSAWLTSREISKHYQSIGIQIFIEKQTFNSIKRRYYWNLYVKFLCNMKPVTPLLIFFIFPVKVIG